MTETASNTQLAGDRPIDFSVVVPVYNSQDSLNELIDGVVAFFETRNSSFEVILVDDHSSDNSWEVLSTLKKNNPNTLTAIRLSRNFGQHNATFCGMGFAKGQFIITIDDDLQTPPGEIAHLIEEYERTAADLVYGVYRRKKHSLFRNTASRTLKKSARVFHDSYGDGSSFRMMTRELTQKILQHNHNFIFIDEVLSWYTNDVSFVVVDHLPRKYNQSGYSTLSLFKMFANLVLYYTTVPLKLLVYGGFTFSLITFAYGLFSIFKKLFFDIQLGYTSLIVTILFSTSIILFSLGVLGEYLSRIYQAQNRKPPFSIKKIL